MQIGPPPLPLPRKDNCGIRKLIEESRVFQIVTFGALHLHQSELDPKQVLLDVMVIANEADAQLREAMRSLIATH
jgi:hypothetical protein